MFAIVRELEYGSGHYSVLACSVVEEYLNAPTGDGLIRQGLLRCEPKLAQRLAIGVDGVVCVINPLGELESAGIAFAK